MTWIFCQLSSWYLLLTSTFRVWLILGILYYYRALTMFITVLPKPDETYICAPKVLSDLCEDVHWCWQLLTPPLWVFSDEIWCLSDLDKDVHWWCWLRALLPFLCWKVWIIVFSSVVWLISDEKSIWSVWRCPLMLIIASTPILLWDPPPIFYETVLLRRPQFLHETPPPIFCEISECSFQTASISTMDVIKRVVQLLSGGQCWLRLLSFSLWYIYSWEMCPSFLWPQFY